MYVRGGARIGPLLWRDRWSLLLLVLLAAATEFLEPYVSHLETFSVVYVGVFSTALSIFLVFRFNESYERWWEARRLWGRLVNLSRDLARQALTLLPEEAGRGRVRDLVHRQIAFGHAMHIHLLHGASPCGAELMSDQLRRLLPDEAERLAARQNVPNAILMDQSECVADLLRESTSDRVLLTRFDETLGGLVDAQGGCERIKNTAFPDAVSLITRILVWSLVVLLLLATVGPSGRGGIMATIAVCVMALGYLWIDALGHDLKDPFEGEANDIPMHALSVSIERDLREMLGETDLPEPVQPEGGVLR